MKYTTKRGDILIFYCYFCHVRTILDTFSDTDKCLLTFVYQALSLLINNNAAELRLQ